MWVYGSGFPKSHNISKAIDKAAGAEREVVGTWKPQGTARLVGGKNPDGIFTNPENAELKGELPITVSATPAAKQWDGWGTALKPAHEPMVLARKPLEGTVANNVLTWGVGGLNIDGSRVGSEGGTKASETFANSESITAYGNGLNGNKKPIALDAGRFPANFIHDGSDEVVALFPDTGKSNVRPPTGKDNRGVPGFVMRITDTQQRGHNDNGDSAARFFYCAKASKRDRNEGLEGFKAKRDHDGRKDGGVGGDNPRTRTNNAKLNHHPTVKPTSLMQYLVRLVTPPNGIVLDPFMGSGSTGKACAYEGFDFVGIDQSAEYVAIAQARIDFALADKSDELPL
jgi:site-specific DNA-methyltransferase (adenine-specific)